MLLRARASFVFAGISVRCRGDRTFVAMSTTHSTRGAKRSVSALLGLFTMAVLSAPAAAQLTGDIAGTVYDKSKGLSAPVANAVVAIGRNYVRTDAAGKYRITRTWTLRGYATTTAPGFDAAFSVYRLEANKTLAMDIALVPRADQVKLSVTEKQQEGKQVDFTLEDQAGAIPVLLFSANVATPPLQLDKEGIQGVLWPSWIRMQSIVLPVVPASGKLDLQFVAPPAGAKLFMQVFSFRSLTDMRLSNGVVSESTSS